MLLVIPKGKVRQWVLRGAQQVTTEVIARDSGQSLGRLLASGLTLLFLGRRACKVVGFDATTGAVLTVPHAVGRLQFVASGSSFYQGLTATMQGRLCVYFRYE